jgi:hypothetical protein
MVSGVGVKGVWVAPAPELIVGKVKEWADAANVQPIHLPGYWLDKQGSDIKPGDAPAAGEKVVYALHGGAYISLCVLGMQLPPSNADGTHLKVR